MNISADTFFRALADTTRLRCLILMQREGELCVCELTYALDMAQPKISRHLAALREAGVVIDRREGQWVHYRISRDLPEWALEVLRVTVEGVSHEAPFAADRASLIEMPNRPGARCCA